MKQLIKKRQFLSLVLFFIASIIVTVSCAPSNETPLLGNSVNEKPVIMGFSAWPGWFPWQVAQEQKLFQANGVNVDLKWFSGYLDSINAMAAGQLDANTQTLNDTISSVAAGSDQTIVLVNDNSTGNDQIIVRKGINSTTDLKGKKIAVEEGTVDHFLLLLGLKQAGISKEDIELVPLETGAAAAAFVAGQVDAVGVFAPFTTTALKREGSKTLFSSKEFPGAIPDHLAVSRKLIEERPEAVQALVNSWFATLKYIGDNPETAYKIMADRAGVSVEDYKEYDAGTTIFTIQDNLRAFAPGENMKSLQYAAKQIGNFLLDSGLIKKEPDYSKLFDDRFVKTYAESLK